MDHKYEMKQGRKEKSKRGANTNTDTNRQNRERGWDNVKFMIWKVYIQNINWRNEERTKEKKKEINK